MYLGLFNKVTNVIEELQQAQRDTEQLYLESSGPEPLVLETEDKEKASPKKEEADLGARQTKRPFRRAGNGGRGGGTPPGATPSPSR